MTNLGCGAGENELNYQETYQDCSPEVSALSYGLGCGAGESNLDFRAEKSTTRILKLERLILVVKFVYTNWDGKEDTEL